MANKASRDARLDRLAEATNAWADKKKDRLTKEATLLKKILKGRTGAERLNNTTVEAASSLQVDELSQFLNGT